MSSDATLTTATPRRRRVLALLAGAAFAAFAVVPAGAAWAGWTAPASGLTTARSQAMPDGPNPQVTVTGRNVTVAWSAAALPGGEAVDGYRVRRVAAGGSGATVGGSCSATQTGLLCTETTVAPGTWAYGVTTLLAGWTGAEGPRTVVTVGAPSFTLASATVTSLPAIVTGTVADYAGPAGLTFRLDDAGTGPILSATAAAVPAAGTAQVAVTLPAGVSEGTHRIFAVGSSSAIDSVAATILVNTVPPRPTALVTANGGATAGAAEAGDSVSVTFSERLKASSLCAAWADDDTTKAFSAGVVVTVTNDGSPSSVDILTVAVPACGPGGFHFGSVNLGDKGFVKGGSTATFGVSGTSSTISWNPAMMTLTIVLGTGSANNFGTVNSSTAVYTPDAAITDAGGLAITGTASRTGRQL
jgi:hypothetical protein